MARTAAAKPVVDEDGTPVEVVRPALTEDEIKIIAETKKVNMEENMRLVLKAAPKRKIRIKKDGNDNSDVFVSINGYRLLIQRGVEVEVPEPVAEILAQGDYI